MRNCSIVFVRYIEKDLIIPRIYNKYLDKIKIIMRLFHGQASQIADLD